MRETFLNCLVELAKVDQDIFLITGDLGFKVLDSFRELFPDRFLNVGIAEQNMIGIAAGLALEGKKVYVYSIANFPTLRCLEQIRNDVCYHDLNIKIVTVGGGFSYGSLGISHHATEDIAIMRSLPNMAVIAPGSKKECSILTKLINNYEHPCYLRLGRSLSDIDYAIPEEYSFGQAIEVKKGFETAILTSGSILSKVFNHINTKVEFNNASFYSMPFIKPFDILLIKNLSKKIKKIISFEDHSSIGGLGSSISEVLTELQLKTTLIKIGLKENYFSTIGSEEFLLQVNILGNIDI